MVTLDNFYQSKEWRRFRQVVINDRMTEDGLILDEVTGKAILRSYDIILHHKIYLTEENVNDASISLNPDNIQIVSHKTHNQIHHKLGYKRREVFLVYGSPLAGKSSYVQEVMVPGDLILDIDRIWSAVSGLEFYQKPATLNSVVFGVRDFIFDCIKTRRGKWQNAYIVGGFPYVSERERICRMYGAREVYIEATKEVCLDRLEKTGDGRDVNEWRKYIDTWWNRYKPG